MIYREKDSIKIPALGFGTWQLKGSECSEMVKTALDIGYRHVDTAQIYENEEHVGTGLEESGVKRDDIFLTTKVWIDQFKPTDLKSSVETSLKKLKTDHVDMLLLHWPNDDVPLEDTLEALTAVQKDGKARLIGVSNFPVKNMKCAIEKCGAPISNNQVEYHPFIDQSPVINYARAHDMLVTAYSPIARGNVMGNDTLKDIASTHNKSAVQISLRWLLQQDGILAIPKSSSKDHAESNFDIFDFELSKSEMQKIFDLSKEDGRLINPDFAPEWDNAKAA